MLRWIALAGAVSALALGGCATMPDVRVHYYLPMSETKVTVTQTVACDAKKTRLIVVNGVNQVTGYRSDPARPQEFAVGALDGAFSDFSSTFTFTDDGRLKTVNAVTTGQGEPILKSAVSLTTIALGAIGATGEGPPEPCDAITAWGEGKPVTLIYSATAIYPNPGGSEWELKAEEGSRSLWGLLKDHLPKLLLTAEPTTVMQETVTVPATKSSGLVNLTLSKVQSTQLKVTSAGSQIWSAAVITPANGTYAVPVPKSALFGKQTFGLTLSDPGAVVSVNYAKDTGVAGGLNVAGAVGTALTHDTAAQQAAATKAQADLIAQQQRLARCEAEAKACS